MGLFDRFRKPPSDTEIRLPKAVAKLADAKVGLMRHYGAGDGFGISGRIVGDIGEREAIAAFGLQPARAGMSGYDAVAPDGRTVQVKTTSAKGVRFTYHPVGADHLICIEMDLKRRWAHVIYNGPEAPVRAVLGAERWNGTYSVSRETVIELDARVAPGQRLQRRR